MANIRELDQIKINKHICVIVTVPCNFEETQICTVVYISQGKATTREAKLDGEYWCFVPSTDFGGYIQESHPALQKLKRSINA